jgi:hypothetical protein
MVSRMSGDATTPSIVGAVLGGFMERMELEELAQSLQKRGERLERKQARFFAGALLLLAVFPLAGWQSVQAPQREH